MTDSTKDLVPIWQDPLEEALYEGIAELLKPVGDVYSCGNKIYRTWLVKFVGFNEPTVTRVVNESYYQFVFDKKRI